MPEGTRVKVAVRFPSFVSADWQERCLATLASVGEIEITALTGATDSADLILDLSTGTIDPRQLTGPKLGYWTFVYGEEPERIDPGLAEFVAGSRAAYIRLVRLNRANSATVLCEGAVKVVSHSLQATRRRLLEAALDWPARQLKETLRQTPRNTLPTVSLRQRGSVARGLLRMSWAVAWIRNVLTRLAQEITREHWAIGVIAQPIQEVCRAFDPAKIRWFPPPPAGFLADPFGLARPDGTLVIMAESLSWQDGRGRIVAFEAQPNGTLTPPRDVFAFASHASYPQLIEYQGDIYCVPETLAQRRVQLFRADPFPHRWLPDTVLLEDFAGADATVHFHAGRWWLFVGNHEDQDETKLFVFHAPRLRGPWVPHAANPVKCDLRSARPAGSLFTMDGELYRPAQDCSLTYGGAVVINKIDRLTPEEFAEHPVKTLTPSAQSPYPHGLHTLSGVGNVTLVDGKRHAISAASLTTYLQRCGRQLNHKLNVARRVIARKGAERSS